MKKNLLLVLAASMLILSSCAFNTPGAYNAKQPYAVQKEGAWSEYACGAFSMAYYLAERGYIPTKKVESKAKALYKKVIFAESSGMYPYSDPRKIKKVISSYASKAELRMHKLDQETIQKGRNENTCQTLPYEEKAEILLCEIAELLNYSDSEIVNIDDFASGLGKNEYAIEIVLPDSGVILPGDYPDFLERNTLHYVLTYWKGDTLYTLDPGRGVEHPRSSFVDGTVDQWHFCNGGIFIKPEK